MSEEIAQDLNKLANLQGKTLYSVINEIGAQALEAERLGFSLEDAIRARCLLQSAKRSRKVLVNQDLWYYASSQAMRTSKGKWLRLVGDSARWDSNVFLSGQESTKGQGAFVDSVKRLVADFFWDCTDFSLEAKGESPESLALRVAFVPEMPLEHTQALFKVFEGMLNVHGFVATDSTVGPGFLAISFRHVRESQTASKG